MRCKLSPTNKGIAAVFLLVPVLGLMGCRITDGQIRREVRARGGELIEGADQFELEGGLTVGLSSQLAPGTISVTYSGQCNEYCWEQVIRTYLDDGSKLVPVKEHTKMLPPGASALDRAVASRQEDRNVDGYTVDTNSATPTTCLIAYSNTNNYQDEPNFPDHMFENNGINDRARLVIHEFELCLRCIDPPVMIGCIKWYYVKIKGNALHGPRSFLVTVDRVQRQPSENFRRAIEAWRNP